MNSCVYLVSCPGWNGMAIWLLVTCALLHLLCAIVHMLCTQAGSRHGELPRPSFPRCWQCCYWCTPEALARYCPKPWGAAQLKANTLPGSSCVYFLPQMRTTGREHLCSPSAEGSSGTSLVACHSQFFLCPCLPPPLPYRAVPKAWLNKSPAHKPPSPCLLPENSTCDNPVLWSKRKYNRRKKNKLSTVVQTLLPKYLILFVSLSEKEQQLWCFNPFLSPVVAQSRHSLVKY